MQSIRIYSALLLVFLVLHRINADLRTCADFDPEIEVAELAHEKELEHILGTFNESNAEHTKEILHLLQRIELDEDNRMNYASSIKLLTHVVSRNAKFTNFNFIKRTTF